MAVTTKDFCAICIIGGRLAPSIAWEGGPICRECLAEAIEENGSSHAPICRGITKREPQLAPIPSPGFSCTTLQ